MKEWLASNFTHADYDLWVEGTPDFLKNSLITNSTFYNIEAEDSVLSINEVSLEIRTTNFTSNKMTGITSSTLIAKAS